MHLIVVYFFRGLSAIRLNVSGIPFCQMLIKFRYFFIFFIPQKAKDNSKKSPAKKYNEGSPSNTKLNNLPNAKPPIKTILVNVAMVQNLGLIIPINQIVDVARYNPIIALKIFVKLIVSTLISNNFDRIAFGYKP